MKYILALIAIISVSASAQTSKSVTKNVSDNGKILQLTYGVTGSGKNINYNNEFDVAGWKPEQKDELVNHIIDSLENNSNSRNDYLHKTINDNGESLTLSIEARKKGKEISYTKTFDVKGLSQQQKNTIIEDVMKSLGLDE